MCRYFWATSFNTCKARFVVYTWISILCKLLKNGPFKWLQVPEGLLHINDRLLLEPDPAQLCCLLLHLLAGLCRPMVHPRLCAWWEFCRKFKPIVKSISYLVHPHLRAWWEFCRIFKPNPLWNQSIIWYIFIDPNSENIVTL